MADRLVIDASVALALLREEAGSGRVKALLSSWSMAQYELLVPSHFWLEVSNSLIRRHRWSGEEVVEGLVRLDEVGLLTIALDRPMLLFALERMASLRLSAYDAVYLCLAIAEDARLATLDGALAAAAGDLGVVVGDDQGRRLSESTTPYQRTPLADAASTWSRSAVVGAHIAELRRRTLASGSHSHCPRAADPRALGDAASASSSRAGPTTDPTEAAPTISRAR